MTHHHNGHAQSVASAATLNSPSMSYTANTNMPSQAEIWFLSFALFAYDPSASIKSNFDRLASQRKWGEKLRRKHWANCQAASAASNNANTSSNVHTQTSSPAGTWFQKYPPFVYDPTAGIKSNFDRLASDRKWSNKLKGKRWVECQTEEFDHAYGKGIDKLEAWQGLCREVYIHNPPESIKGCKKVLGSPRVFVNIQNLIDHRNIGVAVIRFRNYDAFRSYTSRPGYTFPKAKAKKEGFISALLREL